MIRTKVDISQLDRHELRALRDEIDFEIALHDAELRAFYGTSLAGPHPDDDWYCPECEDRDGEVDDLEDEIRAALAALTDGTRTVEWRIETAAARLETAL